MAEKNKILESKGKVIEKLRIQEEENYLLGVSRNTLANQNKSLLVLGSSKTVARIKGKVGDKFDEALADLENARIKIAEYVARKRSQKKLLD